MSSRKGRAVSIYTSDMEVYDKLQESIKNKWYAKYGECLNKSEIIMKSMLLLDSSLESNVCEDTKNTSISILDTVRLFK